MATTARNEVSPFLDPGPRTKANSLAILQLSRDNLLPVYLQPPTGEHDGYAEGAVVNTRYGSFPHSTMLNVPWGSQIRASKVDTGSRGRKRKRESGDDACREATGAGEKDDGKDNEGSPAAAVNGESTPSVKQAVADTSGFIHILPPTPEVWTTSLPHRTQVVYTPDYSYILHRIRARPGSTLIEAGAGSGSFTHASVRAVYNGYPTEGQRKGKVYSFEFHEQRYHKMKQELSDHGLDGLVELTHRDVYNGGFLVDGKSPEADAVFLDLPAPWEALPHLSRRRPQTSLNTNDATAGDEQTGWVSPLNPKKSVYLCTFSPCIEQVTRTVSVMRRLGWVDIDMVEIANRKLHTSRERVGLNLNFDRGVNNSPHDVEEALTRLEGIEGRFREHAAKPKDGDEDMDSGDEGDVQPTAKQSAAAVEGNQGVSADQATSGTAPWMEGRLITRGEPEIKTHTSYLVFAVLPMEWSEEDEAAAAAKYPVGKEQKVIGAVDKAARKQEKREQLQKQQGNSRKARRKERDEKLGEASG
ncbi:S-adenosyl-L-methionine-dependent methyltransferase [Chaetomium strumarium]|uniref:tRNA (adenine(58)-N(1))-methyltransferase catalytic subunit TRM61 n=1 Tax=Chaetomium strumarium TaxID=1170767 RepID=A0AAJ0M4R4_9PEZI|nr:S-adenosyl-L-methionine-dependent methyltransferase [Chaetomium strumarium]